MFGICWSSAVNAADPSVITKADANDYIDCAAQYTTHLAYLTSIGAADEKVTAELKERITFYVNTAKIYVRPNQLSEETKNRFLSSNKEYTVKAQVLLKSNDKNAYENHVKNRFSECKDMLNVNFSFLLKQQGISTEK